MARSLRERRTHAAAPAPPPPKAHLISWHELPHWMRDNEYILSGYRRETRSVRACIHSIYGYIHNETVNIHSHLWGALLFAFFLLTFSARLSEYPTADIYDVAGFATFLTAAVVCLSFSALFHTMTPHSDTVRSWFHALDYIGIVVLIVGTYIPCLHYAFYCEPHLKMFYSSGIAIAGTGAAYVVLAPHYASPAYRSTRASVFTALGLSGIVPIAHTLATHGHRAAVRELGFNWLLAGGACYILGAVIYANRFPERWWPGRFDHWGASHQIFHAHVVAAALMHYVCLQRAAHHWHGVLQASCPVVDL